MHVFKRTSKNISLKFNWQHVLRKMKTLTLKYNFLSFVVLIIVNLYLFNQVRYGVLFYDSIQCSVVCIAVLKFFIVQLKFKFELDNDYLLPSHFLRRKFTSFLNSISPFKFYKKFAAPRTQSLIYSSVTVISSLSSWYDFNFQRNVS